MRSRSWASSGYILVLDFLFLDLFELARQVGSEDEVVQGLVVRGDDFALGALPLFDALFNEDDVVADVHHGVHVVGVDDGRHVVLHGDVVDKVVDEKRGLRVEPGVRFVAEEVLRVERDGPGDGGTLHHTTADLRREEVAGIGEVHTVEAELGTLASLGRGGVGEHVQREHDVLQHSHAVKEGGALEQHAHLAAELLQLVLVHCQEVATVVEYLSGVGPHKTDDVLNHDGLAGAASADDEVGLPVFEDGTNVLQDSSALKGLGDILNFNHVMSALSGLI